MAAVYVGIGSNIEPEMNVPAALREIRRTLRVVALSSFYRTTALGCPEAPPFYNGVVRVETEIAPREMKFGVLRTIEESLGRTRTQDKNAPRSIDLDILVYGDLVVTEPDLVVPDPEITTRPFLAIPLAELAPDLVLPGSGRAIADIADSMRDYPMEPLPAFSRRLQEETASEY